MRSALIVWAPKKMFPPAPHPLLPVYVAFQLPQVWRHIHTHVLLTDMYALGLQGGSASHHRHLMVGSYRALVRGDQAEHNGQASAWDIGDTTLP